MVYPLYYWHWHLLGNEIVHDFIFVRELNIVRTANSDSLESLDIRVLVTEVVKMHQK